MTGNAQNIIRALLRCHVVVVLFYILFCLQHVPFVRADSRIHSSELSLSIEDGLRCVHKKESVTLRCTLSQINVNKSAGWNIVWQSEGELIEQNSSKIFHNTTILTSTLTVYVNWPTDKVFTCFAEYYEGDLLRDPAMMNASITLSIMPQQTHINGVRFVEGSDEKLVEIYWKQNEGFNYTYGLIYTIEDDDFGDQVYVINDIECYRRINDAYRVPNSTGQICEGSIKGATFQEYTEYKVQVNTINGQCQITGPIRKFMLYSLGLDPGPNKYDMVIIPQPVSKFTVLVARREAKLMWQNLENLINNNRWYRLKYNCSGVAIKEQIHGKTDITLYSSDFPSYKPYALCTFCIRVCLEASNVSSLPFCRETRLHEEKPSKPPRITCMGNECATTNDERFRNVTITWSPPPRETWNGVLTRVVVIYRRVGNESSYLMRITERNITRGFTVLPMLSRNSSYVVQTAVCNKEGCSHYGNGSVLGAKVSLEQANESMSVKPGDDLIFPILLGIGLFSLVIGIGVVWCFRKRSTARAKKDDPLPKLNESLDYDNVYGGQIKDKEYDVLSDVGNRNVGLETSDGSQETIF